MYSYVTTCELERHHIRWIVQYVRYSKYRTPSVWAYLSNSSPFGVVVAVVVIVPIVLIVPVVSKGGDSFLVGIIVPVAVIVSIVVLGPVVTEGGDSSQVGVVVTVVVLVPIVVDGVVEVVPVVVVPVLPEEEIPSWVV